MTAQLDRPLATSEQRPTRLRECRGLTCHSDIIGIISTMHHFDSDVEDYPDDDPYADVDDYAGARDNRWRPVALVAAGVLALALLATALIVNGGDSTSTSATVGPAPSRSVLATPRPPRPDGTAPEPHAAPRNRNDGGAAAERAADPPRRRQPCRRLPRRPCRYSIPAPSSTE